MSVVHLHSKDVESEILKTLTNSLLGRDQEDNLYDIFIKTTKVISDRFFSNITWKNYRAWKMSQLSEQYLLRLSKKDAFEKGIEIIIDFNDRYKFNEDASYFSGIEVVEEIINGNFKELDLVINRLKEI